jgi:hypothetical protein
MTARPTPPRTSSLHHAQDRDHIGLVFVEAYADAIWRDREASRQAAEARRAKKALRQGGAK